MELIVFTNEWGIARQVNSACSARPFFRPLENPLAANAKKKVRI